MKKLACFSLIPAFILMGCSGSENVAEDPMGETAPAVAETKAAKPKKPSAQPAADITPIVAAIRTDIQAKRWDDVSVRLGVLNSMPKRPEQEQIFRQLVTEAQAGMLEAMNSGSPEAQRAYQRYSIMVTGR